MAGRCHQRPGRCEQQAIPGFTSLLLQGNMITTLFYGPASCCAAQIAKLLGEGTGKRGQPHVRPSGRWRQRFVAVFRLAKNSAVLWPFYTTVGGLYSNLPSHDVQPIAPWA